MTGSIAERAIQLAEQKEAEERAERDRVRREREEREEADRHDALGIASVVLGRVLEVAPSEVRRQLSYVAHSRDSVRKLDAAVVKLDVPNEEPVPLYVSLQRNALGATLARVFDGDEDPPGIVCVAENVAGSRWEAKVSKLIRSRLDLGTHLLERRREREAREAEQAVVD